MPLTGGKSSTQVLNSRNVHEVNKYLANVRAKKQRHIEEIFHSDCCFYNFKTVFKRIFWSFLPREVWASKTLYSRNIWRLQKLFHLPVSVFTCKIIDVFLSPKSDYLQLSEVHHTKISQASVLPFIALLQYKTPPSNGDNISTDNGDHCRKEGPVFTEQLNFIISSVLTIEKWITIMSSYTCRQDERMVTACLFTRNSSIL